MNAVSRNWHPGTWLGVLALTVLAACAHTGAYDPADLAAARRPAATSAPGKALVYTTAEEDAHVFTGPPTSFTGSATKLTLPLGVIARESARAAFADQFAAGADLTSEPRALEGYAVRVHPRVVDFSYEYNQLKNLGFAITPTVRTTVLVQVLDEAGAVRWERSYPSGDVEDSAYMIDTAPGARITRTAHRALYQVMARAAEDIAREVVGPPGPAKP
jgi:hypothetical protein